MRIGMTYDLKSDYIKLGFTKEEAAEFDASATIDAIESALVGLGHEAVRIGHVHALAQRLVAGESWDLVFNIAEGVYGFARESQVPALLEAYSIPYVFSDPLVLGMALHKGITKHVLAGKGVRTPKFHVVNSQSDIQAVNMDFPLFVKPVAEGTSKGISNMSLCHDRSQLVSTCLSLLSRFRQPVLVEEYLPGREFTVGMVGTGPEAQVLGVMEVLSLSEADQAGYSFDNKQNYHDRVHYRLATDAVAADASEVALAAWTGLGCRDGGRVDVRVDREGRASFIEVNPLAGLHPVDSDLVILGRLLGISYQELIGRIVDSAITRVQQDGPRPRLWFAGHPAQPKEGGALQPELAGASHRPGQSETGPSAMHGGGAASVVLPSRPVLLVLHGEVPPDAPPDEQDMLVEARFAASQAEQLGYRAVVLPFITDLTGMKARIRGLDPSLVFNLVETVSGTGRLVDLCPALLDSMGVPYTGNPTEATFTTANKLVAKRLFAGAGIPTSPWADEAQVMAGAVDFPPPYIIKSLWEHASVGLDEGSVVYESKHLKKRVEERRERLGGSLFVERYIHGREFNMSMLDSKNGPVVLPAAEIRFIGVGEGKPHIVDYKAKWEEDSTEYKSTVRSFTLASSDAPLVDRLKALCLRCWNVFGLAGYARVDFRVDVAGNPWVLEINTNPCLSPDAGFLAAANQAGLSATQVFERIIDAGLRTKK